MGADHGPDLLSRHSRRATGEPNGEPTDAEIAESLRRGERQAELEAWNRFSPGAAQTLRRLLGPGPDREDLLQEVFLRFYKRIGTLREPAAVRGFLFGICVRVVQGELVGRHRRRWLRLTSTGDPPETAVPGPGRRGARRHRPLLRAARPAGRQRALHLRGADDREADPGGGGRVAQRVDLDGAAAPGAGYQTAGGPGAKRSRTDALCGRRRVVSLPDDADARLLSTLSEEARRQADADAAELPRPGAWHRLEQRRARVTPRRRPLVDRRAGAGCGLGGGGGVRPLQLALGPGAHLRGRRRRDRRERLHPRRRQRGRPGPVLRRDADSSRRPGRGCRWWPQGRTARGCGSTRGRRTSRSCTCRTPPGASRPALTSSR